MTRRTGAVLALLAALGGVSSHAQDTDYAAVEVKATQVNGNIWMLEGAGGNIGVSAGPDGILIVDVQFAPLSDKIKAALAAINPGKVRYVVNTHWHGDHTGGNAVFAADAPILAQANVRKRMSTKQEGAGKVSEPSPKEALPTITYDKSANVHVNGEEVKLLYFPAGHTDGDTVVYFTGSYVVHMGDLLFNGRFPIIDVSSGGTVDGYIKNVETVLAKLPANIKVIPGHGPLAGKAEVQAFRDMLAETLGIVKTKVGEGKALDQIQVEGLPEKYASWSWELVDTKSWLATLHGAATTGNGAKPAAE